MFQFALFTHEHYTFLQVHVGLMMIFVY